MIREFRENDIDNIMKLWLETNIQAHDFIESNYWKENFDSVKEMMPQAEIYLYEVNSEIQGFIGLIENYIAGIFVNKEVQSKGIGKKLIDYVKDNKSELLLHVYKKNSRAAQFYLREEFIVSALKIDENTDEVELVMEWRR